MVNPDQPRESFDAAEVVAMPVSRDQVVEVVAPRPIFEHLDNPLGIAVVQAWPSRIDQDRLTVTSHKDGGRPTHDVHEINVERPVLSWRARSNRTCERQRDRKRKNDGPEILTRTTSR
jgi:hypothetical protein